MNTIASEIERALGARRGPSVICSAENQTLWKLGLSKSLKQQNDIVEEDRFRRLASTCGCIAISPCCKYIALVSATGFAITFFDAASLMSIMRTELSWSSKENPVWSVPTASYVDREPETESPSVLLVSKLKWTTLKGIVICGSDGKCFWVRTGFSSGDGETSADEDDEPLCRSSGEQQIFLAKHLLGMDCATHPRDNATCVLGCSRGGVFALILKHDSRGKVVHCDSKAVTHSSGAVCICVQPIATLNDLALEFRAAIASRVSIDIFGVSFGMGSAEISPIRSILLGSIQRMVDIFGGAGQWHDSIFCVFVDNNSHQPDPRKPRRYVLAVDDEAPCESVADSSTDNNTRLELTEPLNSICGSRESRGEVPVSAVLVSRSGLAKAENDELVVLEVIPTSTNNFSLRDHTVVARLEEHVPFSQRDLSFCGCIPRDDACHFVFWCNQAVSVLSVTQDVTVEYFSKEAEPPAFLAASFLAGVVCLPTAPVGNGTLDLILLRGRKVETSMEKDHSTDEMDLRFTSSHQPMRIAGGLVLGESALLLGELTLERWSKPDSQAIPSDACLETRIADVVRRVVKEENELLYSKIENLFSSLIRKSN